MKTLAELKAELVQHTETAKSIQAAADTDGRDLTAEESNQIDNALAEFDRLNGEVGRRERIENASKTLSQPMPRATRSGPEILVKKTMDLNGFVKNVAMNPEAIRAAATTFAGEGTGADGGFLAPTEYSKTLEVLLKGSESILGLCDSITTGSNSIVLPVDEDPVWSASGVAAADVNEGIGYTATKPVLKQVTLTLQKTGVLVPVSEELLADGVNVGGYVAQKSADKLGWKLNAKAMTAFLASGAKIVVAKTGAAAAGTPPDIDNVLAMFQSIPAALRDSAVWFANPRLMGTMMKYVIGQSPVFVSGGSLANAPFDMLLGKRIIWSELCAAQGTAGDLVFVAPKAFYAVTKGTPQSAVSNHLYFDSDQVAFKVSARAAIKSKFSTVITLPDTTTVGNVAVLITR